MLFTKDLKGWASRADKGCVSTLAHTMMTAARTVDSGLAGPGELDRYPYTEALPGSVPLPGPGAVPIQSWVGRADGGRPAGGAVSTANSSSSSVR